MTFSLHHILCGSSLYLCFPWFCLGVHGLIHAHLCKFHPHWVASFKQTVSALLVLLYPHCCKLIISQLCWRICSQSNWGSSAQIGNTKRLCETTSRTYIHNTCIIQNICFITLITSIYTYIHIILQLYML